MRRWIRFRAPDGCDVVRLRADPQRRDIVSDPGFAGCVVVGDGATRVFRCRRDAKRWLLARAAGLAEIPRWPKVCDFYVSTPDAPPPRLPRGWRVLASCVVAGERVTVVDRNRKQR